MHNMLSCLKIPQKSEAKKQVEFFHEKLEAKKTSTIVFMHEKLEAKQIDFFGEKLEAKNI